MTKQEQTCDLCEQYGPPDADGWHPSPHTAHGWYRCNLRAPAADQASALRAGSAVAAGGSITSNEEALKTELQRVYALVDHWHSEAVRWEGDEKKRQGEIERLRAALERYGRHAHPNCHDLTLKADGSFGPRNGCLCGFDAALSGRSAPETKADGTLSRIVACLEPKEPGWHSVHVIEGRGEQFWSALADLFARKGAQETSMPAPCSHCEAPELHEEARASQKASVQDVMCPHGVNRLGPVPCGECSPKASDAPCDDCVTPTQCRYLGKRCAVKASANPCDHRRGVDDNDRCVMCGEPIPNGKGDRI